MMVRYTVSKALTAMTARAFLQKQIGVSLHLWRRLKPSGSFRQKMDSHYRHRDLGRKRAGQLLD